jgi:Rad3-related DNA helicase
VASDPKPVFSVQVRELVEFVLRRGDLGGEHEFSGPDRALAGTRGHHRIQRSRPAGYRKEVPVCREVDAGELILRIQGRIDGVLATPEEVWLEEIKTVQGAWDRRPDPLHWAQAKCYGWIYASDHALQSLAIQLTYLDLDSGEVTEFRDRFALADLSGFFEATTAVYVEWVRQLQHWRQQRDGSIRALGFPFPRYRPGQRELAVAAYRTLARGRRLFIEAPTGIGKTVSVLFPALKAMAEGVLERIFYLTARTVGRTAAEKAFADLRQAGLRLRTMTLTAKDRICPRAGHPCDARGCALARGYYDRRQPAMRAALAQEGITRPVVEAVSQQHQVCPFELSLDVSCWVDAVICDYNYVFDPKVYLRRHFAEPGGDFGFLVDEAHNLVDRAREMFSADLCSREILDASRALKTFLPGCAKSLARLNSALRRLGQTSASGAGPAEGDEAGHELDLFSPESKVGGEPVRTPSRLKTCDTADYKSAPRAPVSDGPGGGVGQPFQAAGFGGFPAASSQKSRETGKSPQPADKNVCPTSGISGASHFRLSNGTGGALALRQLPAHLLPLIEDALKAAETWLAQNQPAEFREALLELYYRLHSFRRTAALYDERYVTIIKPGPPVEVRLFCLDPSFLLQQALERGKAAVFFSATLGPIDYYRALLGGSAEDPQLQLPSPFAPENLAVLVHGRIRTQLKARAGTLADVGGAIGAVVEGRPGNYLVYLPSYEYLAAVLGQFKAAYPAVRTLHQRPGMTEPEREAFLAAFASEREESLVGFAVMGGIFGEGIDLVGDRLIGAIIVGVGLPQLCIERDLIRDYFHHQTGAGFDYAYTFPGMNRVLQATGRVIRSETDRGVVLLIDTRFAQERYRRLFPGWWQPQGVTSAGDIRTAVRRFWRPSE